MINPPAHKIKSYYILQLGHFPVLNGSQKAQFLSFIHRQKMDDRFTGRRDCNRSQKGRHRYKLGMLPQDPLTEL